MKIPFHKACLSEEESDAVADVIKSGWITMGERTFEFERKFADYISSPNAIAVNSCTAALHLALAAAGIKEGDEVILPATTFVSTWEVVKYFNAVPVLADVDRNTHLISVSEIEKHITSKTRAILPVHYAGQACDMDSIMDLAEKNNLFVIDDAAHAFPSTYHGRHVGTLAHASCFSFYATKTVTTGEGGMVTTSNDEWAERIRRLRLHGITKDAWNRYSEKGSWVYDVSEPGYKYNTTDIASAMGIVQLSKTPLMQKRREEIAARYTEAFSSSCLIEPYEVTEYNTSAWHIYAPKLNLHRLKITRDELLAKLNERGIGTSVHFIPLYRFSCMGTENKNYSELFPNSENVFNRTFSLPIYPSMTDAEVDYVIDSVLTILHEESYE